MQSLSTTELKRFLGLGPPQDPVWEVVDDKAQDSLRVRSLVLGPRGLPGILLEPIEPATVGVGVLYCHAHGNSYSIGKAEVLEGRPALLNPSLAIALAQAGASVICVDMPGFGDRQYEGSESALAKAALWRGETLLGQMIADQCLALDVLINLTQPTRTMAVGISMGGTLAYLTTALREDISAVAQMCVFSNIAPLIETGAHDLHGPYMTIPGLLPDHDMSDIASLVFPRPQFVATGALDPLTPDPAYAPAMARLQQAYHAHPDRLTVLRDAAAGHHETPEMRKAVLKMVTGDPPNES